MEDLMIMTIGLVWAIALVLWSYLGLLFVRYLRFKFKKKEQLMNEEYKIEE